MAEQQEGFAIRGKHYQWPQQWRALDSLLVTEITGMKYKDFMRVWQDSLSEDQDGDDDPILSVGLMAVAFWQAHPDWGRARVIHFFEQLDSTDIEVFGVEDTDEVPPPSESSDDKPNAATSDSSPLSPTTSNGTPESRSEPVTRPTTGTPQSVTGFPV